jgi:putative SOS response-associated peptidase YedK
MCGRFTLKATPERIKTEFKTASILPEAAGFERFNIAPSQMIAAVLNNESERVVTRLKWGLVPSWAKDLEIGNRMINARSETITEKPSFREAFKKRRCIIPSSGFYEWQKIANSGGGGKQPFYFYLKEKEVFGFAGLYEEWTDKQTGELLETCTIITTVANAVLKPVHDRMPVILAATDYDEWLDQHVTDTEQLQKLLVPYSADAMASHTVSRAVNIPTSDEAGLIEPVNSK